MKILARLEKTKVVWGVITLCIVFFFLRFPSIIEPYWYGDEGIYEVVGTAINHGQLLYRDVWDNKPPMLYVVYALAQGDQPTVKILSLIAGLLSVVAFFFLTQKLFNKSKVSILTTTLFVLLFATPLLEANIANAEDFILLPIIAAALLIYQLSIKFFGRPTRHQPPSPTYLLTAGLLLGIAFLFKIVALFDLTAFIVFFLITQLPEQLSWSSFKKTFFSQQVISTLGKILFGFLVPFLLTTIYFASNHALHDFFQSAFFDNVDYVGWQNSLLGIPQGLLLVKCILLVLGVVLIVKKRKLISKPVLFILLWLIFALFDAYFSGRPYTHYALVLLPSFCLFVGLLFTNRQTKIKMKIMAIALVILIALSFQFHFNTVQSFSYYQNVIQFLNGQKTIESYQSFFDKKVPRDYTVASFIKSHTSDRDTVFIWGNNPQIYVLSHKLPLGKYTVAYHVAQNNGFDETQSALNKGKPKYIIVLTETAPLPFVIPLYIMRYNITGATIYERSL